MAKGKYGFRLRSVSLAMTGAYTDYQFIDVYDQSYSALNIMAVLLLAVSSAVIALHLYQRFFVRCRVRNSQGSQENMMMNLEEINVSAPPKPDDSVSLKSGEE